MSQLYHVAWCNVWNRSAASHRDGAGTRLHLTDSASVRGKTLCGKTFPADKGYPSWTRACQSCLKKARAAGVTTTRDLPWVRSVEE